MHLAAKQLRRKRVCLDGRKLEEKVKAEWKEGKDRKQ